MVDLNFPDSLPSESAVKSGCDTHMKVCNIITVLFILKRLIEFHSKKIQLRASFILNTVIRSTLLARFIYE